MNHLERRLGLDDNPQWLQLRDNEKIFRSDYELFFAHGSFFLAQEAVRQQMQARINLILFAANVFANGGRH